jgi:hypothetical protein
MGARGTLPSSGGRIVQYIRSKANNINRPKQASAIAAQTRIHTGQPNAGIGDGGRLGRLGGTGGSRIPAPVNFPGGAPWAEDDCGSGSSSYSVNSWGIGWRL